MMKLINSRTIYRTEKLKGIYIQANSIIIGEIQQIKVESGRQLYKHLLANKVKFYKDVIPSNRILDLISSSTNKDLFSILCINYEISVCDKFHNCWFADYNDCISSKHHVTYGIADIISSHEERIKL
jgi:hypothetical protein